MSHVRAQAFGKMRKLDAILVFGVIGASMSPAVALGCTSSRDIAASRARWAAVRGQPANASDSETNCRAYAGSFYESVTLRQATAMCLGGPDHDRNLALLNSEINIFNNLLATKCGG